MRVGKTEYDIIVREIYNKLTDDDQTIEIELDDYDVIVDVSTTIDGHYEIGAEYMGSFERVPVVDSEIHTVVSVEVWNKDGSVQYNSDYLLERLQKDIV
ncbi:MAG: hypothetical protein J6U43_00605 [Bacteroidales bacterium]|nr:hypothetical protein [Bacteroidales bacterium]